MTLEGNTTLVRDLYQQIDFFSFWVARSIALFDSYPVPLSVGSGSSPKLLSPPAAVNSPPFADFQLWRNIEQPYIIPAQ